MKVIVFIFIYILTLTLVHAGTFEDGLKAYNDKKYQTAIIFFEEACEQGSAESCNKLGVIYLDGIPGSEINTDYDRSFNLFKRGCDRNNAESCCRLVYLYGQGLGTKKNTDKMISMGIKSCNLNYGVCCGGLSMIFGLVKDFTDFKKSKMYAEKGCNLRDSCSCLDLSMIYQWGHGIKKDEDKASYYLALSDQYGGCPNKNNRVHGWSRK